MALPVNPNPNSFIPLTEQEYVAFCDLIICGSEMAEYLLTTRRIATPVREHARYWQKLAQKLKPLLHRVQAVSPLPPGR